MRSYNPAMNSILHDELELLLSQLKAGVGAAELHGSVAGFIAGGGRCNAREWGDALAIDAVQEALLTGGDDGDALQALYDETASALADPDDAFAPLLPDDESALGGRVDALVAWCRGFLGGLGLANIRARGALSDDAEEAMTDLARIGASDLATDESESDEDAYVEVLEFVRIAALLLRDDCARAARRH